MLKTSDISDSLFIYIYNSRWYWHWWPNAAVDYTHVIEVMDWTKKVNIPKVLVFIYLVKQYLWGIWQFECSADLSLNMVLYYMIRYTKMLCFFSDVVQVSLWCVSGISRWWSKEKQDPRQKQLCEHRTKSKLRTIEMLVSCEWSQKEGFQNQQKSTKGQKIYMYCCYLQDCIHANI